MISNYSNSNRGWEVEEVEEVVEEKLEGDEKDYKHVLSDNTSLCLPYGVTDGFIIK